MMKKTDSWAICVVLLAMAVLVCRFTFPAEFAGETTVVTPTVKRYEKVEIAHKPQVPPKNPFNPNEVEVVALIRTPTGEEMRVPAFWFQEFRRSVRNPEAEGIDRVEVLEAIGDPQWRVRFSSGEVGNYACQLELKDASGVRSSRKLTFRITDGPHRGFIRKSPRNPHYLANDSGDPFFPIGQNLCMYQKKEGTFYFDRLLKKLSDAGGNYVRLWQEYYVPRDHNRPAGPGDAGFTGFPLETQITGLGRYDLTSAWRLDRVAELCEELDVYWQLSSEMVVWWQRRQPHRWGRNPYNAANGGPCIKPLDYLVDPEARELARRRLRYNVARWGWTTKLVAWELWNEVDNLEGFQPKANADWHREMATYLKSIDPWQHLITTSWRDPQMFALPGIDIVQAHSYFPAEADAAQYSLQDSDHLMRPYGKPFFFGEQGIQMPASVDPQGKHFHDCLWATAMSGAAGTGLYWWWHNYIEPYNLYHHYTALAKFVENIEWPAYSWRAIRLSRPNNPVTLQAYGLVTDDRAMVWVHDPLAFRVIEGQAEKGPSQTGTSLNVVGLADGDYQIEWWNTSTGEILRVDHGNVNHLRHYGYGLELEPPEFWGDIAAKVIPED